MKRREFLMLAHNYKDHAVGGWFLSEKLDGMRAVWLPHTRGIPKSDILWANHDKDSRYVTPPVATGLWSRYGNVIHAPDWWLDKLPNCPLDGELYIPGFRQELMKTVKKLKPGSGWKDVKFYVFDIPPYPELFKDGRLTAVNFTKEFVSVKYDLTNLDYHPEGRPNFRTVIKLMVQNVQNNKIVVVHEQIQLPYQTTRAKELVQEYLTEITDRGGEGLILRSPSSKWEPKRSHQMLKVKKLQDSEAIVTGYRTGKETDKGSRHLGRMGSLVVYWDGVEFELSGFTDEERSLETSKGDGDAVRWAELNDAKITPDWIHNPHFPRGTKVTFRYRDLTKDGVPQEARYWRKHEA